MREGSSGGAVVLVVDDHADTSFAICTLLELEGYRADGASTGRQALEMVGERRYDLVITDLILPDISGYDLVRALRQRRDYLPVLAVSARDDLDASNFDDALPKPFNNNVLLAKIRRLLELA
jgi:DNA-binding response OmpR family regulator